MSKSSTFSRIASALAKLFTAFVLVFMLLPLVTMLSDSFAGSNAGILSFPPKGFSFSWYQALFQYPQFASGLQLSLILGLSATLSSLLVAITMVIALRRYSVRGASILRSYALSPLIVPEVVTGLAMLELFRVLGILGTFFSLFLAHVVITLPYALRILEGAFTGIDASLEDAARTLGANELKTFRYVTFNLIQSGITASLIFGFIVSFNDIAMTAFLTTTSLTTVSVVIFGWATQLYTPILASASGLITFATFIFLLLIDRTIGLDRSTAFIAYR